MQLKKMSVILFSSISLCFSIHAHAATQIVDMTESSALNREYIKGMGYSSGLTEITLKMDVTPLKDQVKINHIFTFLHAGNLFSINVRKGISSVRVPYNSPSERAQATSQIHASELANYICQNVYINGKKSASARAIDWSILPDSMVDDSLNSSGTGTHGALASSIVYVAHWDTDLKKFDVVTETHTGASFRQSFSNAIIGYLHDVTFSL
ncbi:MAG: hypothetical protein AAGB31_01605 [Bdellovibrio sp.]